MENVLDGEEQLDGVEDKTFSSIEVMISLLLMKILYL